MGENKGRQQDVRSATNAKELVTLAERANPLPSYPKITIHHAITNIPLDIAPFNAPIRTLCPAITKTYRDHLMIDEPSMSGEETTNKNRE